MQKLYVSLLAEKFVFLKLPRDVVFMNALCVCVCVCVCVCACVTVHKSKETRPKVQTTKLSSVLLLASQCLCR